MNNDRLRWERCLLTLAILRTLGVFVMGAVFAMSGAADEPLVPAPLPAEKPTRLAQAAPEELGFAPGFEAAIDAAAQKSLDAGETPGLVIAVGRGNRLAYLKAFGFRQIEPEPLAMTTDSIFDMASVTKPVATATAIGILLDAGKIELDKPIAFYLPEFGRNGKEQITIADCLTHTAGLRDPSFERYRGSREEIWSKLCDLYPSHLSFSVVPAKNTPDHEVVRGGSGKKSNVGSITPGAPRGESYCYQCVHFITLAFLVEKISGEPFERFTAERIFQPLGMFDSGFVPDEAKKSRSVTTEFDEASQTWLRGVVHDPPARGLGGVSGNAGLFSTAPDLAVFAAMMLGGGTLRTDEDHAATILSPETTALLTAPRSVPLEEEDRRFVGGKATGLRSYGWDIRSPHSGNRAANYSDRAFGHGGFTGTVLWIDPGHDLFVIVLGNRLHPKRQNNHINRLGAEIGRLATCFGGNDSPDRKGGGVN